MTRDPDERLPYRVESVDTALRVLLLLHDDPGLRVTAVAQRLGVAASTAHRLLTTLAARGFLVQDRVTKSYRAGPALVELGVRSSGSFGLREASEAHLDRLVKRVGESASVVALIGPHAQFVAGVEAPDGVRTQAGTGVLLPAYATAGGKVLLAELPRSTLRELYPSGLKKLTEKTMTFTQLVDELALVAMRGYSVNDGESDLRVRAIAVPLRNAAGRTVAAVAVLAQRTRLRSSRYGPVVHELRECAARIREDLPLSQGRT